MRTTETAHDARACILDMLSRRRDTAGNLARKMMGAGMLANSPASYALVAESLAGLLVDGLVAKTGNGKAVQWRLAGRAATFALAQQSK